MAMQLVSRLSEVKLVELLHDMEDGDGWQAVHFQFDRLLEEYKSDYQIKIAINLINDLLKAYEGTVFILSDRGLVILCEGAPQSLLNKLIFQLRYLYTDDPLAYTDDGIENPSFCTLYNLTDNKQAFADFVSQRMARTVRKTAPAPASTRGSAMAKSMPVLESSAIVDLNASLLAEVEAELKLVDLSKSIRKQAVCAVTPTGVRPVFDELYIHIAHLRQIIKSDVDFFSNRWLFKYLTQTLDERMLSLASRNPEQYFSTPVSINLNAETLLSAAFTEFDAAIPAAIKVSIIIEMPVIDMFSDITGFIIAKNEIQKLGYRVCLDGLTTKGFIHIDREKLGVDLVKVQWNADVQGDLQSKENQDLIRAVQHCGSKRIILCRCDSRHAVEYGQALGIALFQGRHIDTLINHTSTVEN